MIEQNDRIMQYDDETLISGDIKKTAVSHIRLAVLYIIKSISQKRGRISNVNLTTISYDGLMRADSKMD